MRLKISEPANADIDELYRYGRNAHGERHADRYLMGLLEALERIAADPFGAQQRNEADPPVRLHVYMAHNIIYDVGTVDVVILRILHHSMNWMDEF